MPCPCPLGACSPLCALASLCLPCPWPLSACSTVGAPGVLCVRCLWQFGARSSVRAPIVQQVRCSWHRCARMVCCVCGDVHLVFLVCGVLDFLALVNRCVRMVCTVCGVRGHLEPVPWCARPAFLVCGVLGPLVLVHRCGRMLCCVCGVSGHLAILHRCACLVCCVCGVLGHLALVHRCAGLVCSVCIVVGHLALVDRCAPLVCCLCRVLDHLAFVHQCAGLVRCVVSCGVLRFCVSTVVPPCAPRARAPYESLVWFVFLRSVTPSWHLVLVSGCCRYCASLASLVAWRSCALSVRFGSSRCARRLSPRRASFSYQVLAPLVLLGGCAGHEGDGQDPGSWCLLLAPARQERWCGSASYLFGAPLWGCPRLVPPASVSGCVRCTGFAHVLTRSLTRVVSCTFRRATEDSAGAPRLFCVDADTSPFRVVGRHARVCVYVCVC